MRSRSGRPSTSTCETGFARLAHFFTAPGLTDRVFVTKKVGQFRPPPRSRWEARPAGLISSEDRACFRKRRPRSPTCCIGRPARRTTPNRAAFAAPAPCLRAARGRPLRGPLFDRRGVPRLHRAEPVLAVHAHPGQDHQSCCSLWARSFFCCLLRRAEPCERSLRVCDIGFAFAMATGSASGARRRRGLPFRDHLASGDDLSARAPRGARAEPAPLHGPRRRGMCRSPS